MLDRDGIEERTFLNAYDCGDRRRKRRWKFDTNLMSSSMSLHRDSKG